MFKKVNTILVLLLMVFALAGNVYALGFDAIYSKETASTEQFLVNITRPDGNESAFNRKYLVCGNTQMTGRKARILIYNLYTGVYETYSNPKYITNGNPNGYCIWDIGNSKMFMKEIQLPNEGANLVRIVAYNKNIPVERLEWGKNLQVSNFTVTFLDSEIRDAIISLPSSGVENDIIRDDIFNFTNLFMLFGN